MSADSRVVACDHIWAVGYGVPAYCMQCGRPQEPDYKSLLAEAEELAERNRNHWHTMKAERDSLQSRLDAVLNLLRDWYEEELRDDGDNRRNAPGHCHDVPGIWDPDNGKRAGKPCARCALWFSVRAAALGCATTGEEK